MDKYLNSSTDVNVNNFCRICLGKNAVKDIYQKKLKNSISVPYYVMMSAIFSLAINQNDGLPSKLCKRCCSKLLSAYKLKLLAEQSLNKLLSYISKNETKSQDLIYDKNEINLLNNNSTNDIKDETEIKQEIDGTILIEPDIKDECLENVLRISENNEDLNFDDEPKQDTDSEYDFDDDTPLLFYGAEDKLPKDSILEREEKISKRKTKQKKHSGRVKLKLKKDMKISKKSGSCVCHLCGKFVRSMSAHSVVHSENRRKYPCGDCPKLFSTYGARKKHRNVHHLGKLYFCQICNKTYKRGYDHIRAKHSDKPKLFACVLCERRFREKAQLTFHITMHTKEKPHTCDVCGKAFRTNAACNFHRRRVHDKEKTHECHICHMLFFAASTLKVHIRSHTKEKIYKCTHCEKSFTTSSGLLVHKKRHQGIKKHNCEICAKVFVTAGALKIHMVSHTKEKIHPCRYCGVKFGRTDHRNRHERTAHKDKQSTIDNII